MNHSNENHRQQCHVLGAHPKQKAPLGAGPEAASKPAEQVGGLCTGGEGGIRTLGSVATTPDFESGTFDHSATSPDSVSFVEGGILSGAQSVQAAHVRP